MRVPNGREILTDAADEWDRISLARVTVSGVVVALYFYSSWGYSKSNIRISRKTRFLPMLAEVQTKLAIPLAFRWLTD